jgi:hypothetical protein
MWIQRHLFGCLYVEQAGNFSRWDRSLDLLLIALGDLTDNWTMGPACQLVLALRLCRYAGCAAIVRRSLIRAW